jgi:hypothetical protein
MLFQPNIHIIGNACVMAVWLVNALKNIDVFHAFGLVRLRCSRNCGVTTFGLTTPAVLRHLTWLAQP